MEFRAVEQLAALPELAIFKKESQADFGWNSIVWDEEFAENLAIFDVLVFKIGYFYQLKFVHFTRKLALLWEFCGF